MRFLAGVAVGLVITSLKKPLRPVIDSRVDWAMAKVTDWLYNNHGITIVKEDER